MRTNIEMKYKKIGVLAIAVISSVFLFTGCGEKVTVESLATNADKKITAAESADLNLKMDLDMDADFLGATMNTKMDMDLDVQYITASEASYIAGNVNIGILGMSIDMNMENYTIKDGEKYIAYTKTESNMIEDEGWNYEEVDAQNFDEVFNVFSYIAKNSDKFILEENTEKYSDIDCYVVTGILPGEAFNEITKMMGATGEELFETEDENVDYSLMDIDIKLYFNKDSKDPVCIEMDMTDGFNRMMEAAESKDETVSTANVFEMSVIYNSFNSVKEITVPEDVKNSAKEAIDDSSLEVNIEDNEYPIDDSLLDDISEEIIDNDNYTIIEGDYLKDFSKLNSFILNEKTLTLPCKVSDLTDLGLALDDYYIGYMVNKKETSIINMVTDGSDYSYIGVFVYNPNDEASAVDECEVYGISLYSDSMGNATASLSAGIDFTKTYDEVIALLGTPTEEYDSQYTKTLGYETEDSSFVLNIDIDAETNLVSGYSISNYYMY